MRFERSDHVVTFRSGVVGVDVGRLCIEKHLLGGMTMRRSTTLVAVLAVVSILVTPALALAARSEKAVTLNASGTQTSTAYCDVDRTTGLYIEFEGQAVGQHIGAGTVVWEVGIGSTSPVPGPGTMLGPGPFTFTDASGLNTLTGTLRIVVEQTPMGPMAGNVLTVSSGTGKFADVTGGRLATELTPTGGIGCGTTSAPFNLTFTGTLSYS
jgi:hypothetical protein